jgi:hypothetical protein
MNIINENFFFKFFFVKIIKLIFKKKNYYDIKNYQPIILFNVNYKILMKVLVNRLNLIFKKFFSP